VVCQKSHDAVHRVEVGAVEQVPAFATGIDEVRVAQRLQVEGERGRRDVEAFDDLARCVAFRAAFDQQPEQREAGFLGEGSEGDYCGIRFHDSKMTKV
jgi:hypothetical protein